MLILVFFVGNASAANQSITIENDYVEMRKGPGEAFPVFYIAERGEQLKLLRQQNEWVLARLNERVEGWLAIDDVLSAFYRQRVTLQSTPLGKRKFSVNMGWFDGSGEYGFGLGYRLTTRVSAGLFLQRIVNGVTTTNVLQPRLDLQAFEYSRFNPIASVGVSLLDNQPERNLVDSASTVTQMFSYALGVRYFSSPALMINVLAGGNNIVSKQDQQHWNVRLEWESAF